ncbi:MAG: hypothetical protein AAF639_07385 [Chloroflexota bacterium]
MNIKHLTFVIIILISSFMLSGCYLWVPIPEERVWLVPAALAVTGSLTVIGALTFLFNREYGGTENASIVIAVAGILSLVINGITF